MTDPFGRTFDDTKSALPPKCEYAILQLGQAAVEVFAADITDVPWRASSFSSAGDGITVHL